MSDKELIRAAEELAAIQREMWEADIELRKAAENDPALAAIIAEADAQYERTYGVAWRNPLTDSDAAQ